VSKERTAWIDIARGIGIIFVIYGHTLGPMGFRYLIYAFHMPLFFFLSGLVFKNREGESYPVSLKKDLKRIIIPYFIFAFISLGLWWLNLNSNNQTVNSLTKQIIGIFYGNASNGYLAINTVLWFLPCLFLVKQIFWFLSKLNTKALILTLLIFSIIGFISSVFFSQIRLPFGLESALTGIVFFGAGYLWNNLPVRLNSIFTKYNLFLIIVFIFLTIYFADLNFQVYGLQIDIRLNRLNNYFYFYIAAFSGILATILTSKLINRNKILEYLGQKTLVLFIWHYFVFIYLNRLFFALNPAEEIVKIRNAFYPLLYTTLSILIILVFDYFFQKIKQIPLKLDNKNKK
jgi:acyltransferase